MSKFLKFIVHFFVICTIVCVLGLALPPFFGVRTVIMDSSDKATNLPVGSVTYAIPVKTEDVAAGTPILVQEDGKSYRYNLVSVNRENNTGTVIDTTTSAQQNITVSVKNWVPKIVVTIPFVGYSLVATESIEGLIILGLVILFLIILYVIAELWKKEPDDIQDDMEDPEPGYVKSKKELKREEKARARRMKEEEKESMDRAMQSYAACLEKFTGKKFSEIPGTGAAGGLGFAFLWGLPNVELKPGIDIVLEAVGLASELQDADIVVTGEGCLDFQTAMGKGAVFAAKVCALEGAFGYGVPILGKTTV